MKQSMAEGPDDFNEVLEKIQIKIVSYIETTLFPAILNHIASESSDSCQYGSLEKFCEDIDSLASSFVQTNREYLLKLNNVTEMPNEVFLKIYGKDLIGAAIHISKAMGKPNFVDELQDIVDECFIPNEEPDLTYPWRDLSFKW
jgi:hypothetical protein